MSELVAVVCPNCDMPYNVSENRLGLKVTCKKCERPFILRQPALPDEYQHPAVATYEQHEYEQAKARSAFAMVWEELWAAIWKRGICSTVCLVAIVLWTSYFAVSYWEFHRGITKQVKEGERRRERAGLPAAEDPLVNWESCVTVGALVAWSIPSGALALLSIATKRK